MSYKFNTLEAIAATYSSDDTDAIKDHRAAGMTITEACEAQTEGYADQALPACLELGLDGLWDADLAVQAFRAAYLEAVDGECTYDDNTPVPWGNSKALAITIADTIDNDASVTMPERFDALEFANDFVYAYTDAPPTVGELMYDLTDHLHDYVEHRCATILASGIIAALFREYGQPTNS